MICPRFISSEQIEKSANQAVETISEAVSPIESDLVASLVKDLELSILVLHGKLIYQLEISLIDRAK